MGFNIAGLAIATNYDKDITKLGDSLAWDIEVIEEISFEEAAANWTPEGEFRLYFSEKATLIFFPHEWAMERYHTHEANSLCYAYSATAMTFLISYVNIKENYGRFLMVYNNKVQLAEGQEIPYEAEGLSADAMTFKLLEDTIGENFHEIDFAAKAYRCKKRPPVSRPSVKPEAQKVEKASAKKWWEFWK